MPVAYSIQTERLLLRPWRDEDVEPYVALATEAEFMHFPLGRAAGREEAHKQLIAIRAGWMASGMDLFAAELKESSELIGFIGLTSPNWLPEVLPATEIGWRIGRKFWGRGLATEGAKATVKFGFEHMFLSKILCIYQPENVRSAAVAQRCGFREYKTTEHPRYPDMQIKLAELTSTRYYMLNP